MAIYVLNSDGGWVDSRVNTGCIIGVDGILDFFIKTKTTALIFDENNFFNILSIEIDKLKKGIILELSGFNDDSFHLHFSVLCYDFMNYSFKIADTYFITNPQGDVEYFLDDFRKILENGFKLGTFPVQISYKDGSLENYTKFIKRSIQDSVFTYVLANDGYSDICQFGIVNGGAHSYKGRANFTIDTSFFTGGPVECIIFVKIENPFK